jgi:hypothetical protein
MSDGASETFPKSVSTKSHGMMRLQWASMVTPLIEHGTIKEGELIQIASEKRITPYDHSTFVASSRHASSGGSGGRGSAEGLGESSVRRFLE